MNFSKEVIDAVWRKGRIVGDNDPNVWRKDKCGAWIRRSEYGNRDSQYGWEIDHINPNGSDQLSNLQPLQWRNNARKGDGPDGLGSCAVTASGTNNKAA